MVHFLIIFLVHFSIIIYKEGAEFTDVHRSDGHIFVYSDHCCLDFGVSGGFGWWQASLRRFPASGEVIPLRLSVPCLQSKTESRGIHTIRTTGGAWVVRTLEYFERGCYSVKWSLPKRMRSSMYSSLRSWWATLASVSAVRVLPLSEVRSRSMRFQSALFIGRNIRRS